MARIFRPIRKTIDPKTGRTVTRRDEKWYGDYNDADGKRCRVPLSVDKLSAQAELNQIVQTVERQRTGVLEKVSACFNDPVEDSIAEYQQHLGSNGRAEKHISETIRLIRRVITEIGCDVLGDLQRAKESLNSYFQSRKKEGVSNRTVNADLTAVRSFCRWLMQNNRLTIDPTIQQKKENVKLDRRRKRRPLTDEEATKLFNTTLSSKEIFRGLTGQDRAMLYMVAQRTGLRRRELLTLLPRAFKLDGETPTVCVEASNAKGRKQDVLPLPAEVANELAPYLKNKPRSKPIWPGNWWEKSADMFRTDLVAAGIEIIDDDGRVLDFHGQRTTFITALARAGVSPAKAQKLARHSDINLTMNTYTHLDTEELVTAVESLPSLRDGKHLREKGIADQAGVDSDLKRLNEVWPALSIEIRRAIGALIQSSVSTASENS